MKSLFFVVVLSLVSVGCVSIPTADVVKCTSCVDKIRETVVTCKECLDSVSIKKSESLKKVPVKVVK